MLKYMHGNNPAQPLDSCVTDLCDFSKLGATETILCHETIVHVT